MGASKSMKARPSSSISCSSFSFPLLILLLTSSIFSTFATQIKANDDQDQQHMKPSWVNSIISLTDTAFPYTSMYLERGKVAFKKLHGYFFRPTPDIDFRSSTTGKEVGETVASDVDVIAASKLENEECGGVGERVREAATKSLEKTKLALEKSAKLAGDTLHEVTDRLKHSFRKEKDQAPHAQPEL